MGPTLSAQVGHPDSQLPGVSRLILAEPPKHFCLQCDADMKLSAFKRELAALGARFEEGAKHTKVYLNGRQTTLPRHGGAEIGKPFRRAILKQLNVKD